MHKSVDFIGLALVVACSGGDPYKPDFSQRAATGAECPTGGTTLLVDGEIGAIACNGAVGEQGPPGANGPLGQDDYELRAATPEECPNGGIAFLTLDGVDSIQLACSGEDGDQGPVGLDGAQGQPGAPGAGLAIVESLHCQYDTALRADIFPEAVQLVGEVVKLSSGITFVSLQVTANETGDFLSASRLVPEAGTALIVIPAASELIDSYVLSAGFQSGDLQMGERMGPTTQAVSPEANGVSCSPVAPNPNP